MEDTGEIDEAGICGCWSDDDDSGVDTCEAWLLSVEGNNMPADAEFLPLDSACEEHTCPWNVAEDGRFFSLSNVQLRNASGLLNPSGRKVKVSYDVLGPAGRVVLHAQTPFVQSDFKKPLLCVGKLTKSGAEVKFESKGSRIDLHTDSGMQRVLVRVKGNTFGLSIQKTLAWIIPETDDAAPHVEVAPVEEEISMGEAPNPPSTAPQAPSVLSQKKDSRNAARARSP